MRSAHPPWCASLRLLPIVAALLIGCSSDPQSDPQELARVKAELATKTAELEALQLKYNALNEELRAKMTTLDDNVSRTLLELGKVNDLQGKPQQAIESFERYLEQRPNAADAQEIANNIAQIKAELRAAEGGAGSARE